MQIAKFKSFTFHFALILSLAAPGAASQSKAPQAVKVSITTRLDKTALWVGDTLNYTIQAIHDREIEFVLDNLKKENLSLAPFEVRAITIQQGEWAQNKRLLEVSLLLSTYESGKTELTIPSFNLYYFIHEPGLGKKESLAEAVQVPAAKVGLRSTLSGGQIKPRDFKPVAAGDLRPALIALILGLAGMVFVSLRMVRWAWISLHRDRSTRRRLSRQARDKLVREGLARIRMIGRESPDDLFRFYAEVSQFLRQYLSQRLEIEAVGLTPEEIEPLLVQVGTNGSSARQIRAILDECDRVRYGKDSLRLGSEDQKGLLEALERVMTSPAI